MFQKMSKILIMLLLISFLLPNFCFAQEPPPIEAPETIEEGKNMALRAAEKIIKLMPGIVIDTWRNDVVPLWARMWQWFKNFWKSYAVKTFDYIWYLKIKPSVKSLFYKIEDGFLEFLGKEVKERRPIIEQEIEKEKQELKEEFPRDTETFWERFKDLLK